MIAFPVTESTLSADHLGPLLQERYALGAGIKCKLFRTGMNHLYMVTDGSNRVVFRVYTLNWRTRLEIAEELRLLTHLKQNRAPVAYAIADKTGEWIQDLDAPEGRRYGVLFSFADGTKNARFSPEASYQVGQALAKIHQETEGFILDRVTYNNNVLLIDSMARTKRFFKNASEEIAYLDKLAAFAQHKLEGVNSSKIRNGAVHLDVWFDNMHFTENNDVTIFDFDFCGNGLLCFDISYFLFQLYSTNLNEEDYQLKAKKFLEGYESLTPITDEEKRILPFGCLAIMIFYLSVQCDRYDTWSNIFLNEDHLKRFVGMLKRWVIFNQFVIE